MDELSERAQDTLRRYLETELQHVTTLIEMARTHLSVSGREAALQSLDRAGVALAAVERFSRRMPSEERPALLQSVADFRARMDVVRGSMNTLDNP